MEKSISSLVKLVGEKVKDDPLSRRIWSTAKIANQFARIIRNLRNQRQQSEVELAREIGCSVDVIVNIENPTSNNTPSLENMIAVADALGYEVSIEMNPVDSSVAISREVIRFGEPLFSSRVRSGLARLEVRSKRHCFKVSKVGLPRTIGGVKIDKRKVHYRYIVKTDESK